MNPRLQIALDGLEAQFRADPRCLGMYVYGSIAAGSADDDSDLDVAIVVAAEDYQAARRDLRAACERACGPALVWWFKGERPGYSDYAFLVENDDRLLACDISVNTPLALTGLALAPEQILFDRAGALRGTDSPPKPDADAPPYADLLRAIGEYWVFMSVNGKYARRGDTFKLLYVQQRLFQTHLRLLGALHPEARGRWWAEAVGRLPAETQREMLGYFGAASAEAAAASLDGQIALFARDARVACARFGLEYRPDAAAGVRRHLASCGLPVQAEAHE